MSSKIEEHEVTKLKQEVSYLNSQLQRSNNQLTLNQYRFDEFAAAELANIKNISLLEETIKHLDTCNKVLVNNWTKLKGVLENV